MQTFTLPWGPTANTMWKHSRGQHYLSDRYKKWKTEAGKELMVQRVHSMSGPVQVRITLSYKGLWDLDNRIKPILDLLVSNQIIDGDSKETVKRIITEIGEGFEGSRITISKLTG